MNDATPIELTPDQNTAKAEIMAAMAGATGIFGKQHTLGGYAGTGKTTLTRFVVREMHDAGRRVVVCAPTNKAVAVLEANMRAAEITVPTMTIYKLLGLTPGNEDEKRKPKRVGRNWATKFDVVIIDECSMLGADIMDWIRRDLQSHFVLYIGDPAQLPPIGENISQSFEVESRSALTRVMRQAETNPIIALATDIRGMIDRGFPDWDRFQAADDGGPAGIYAPGDAAMPWIDDMFTSPEFAADNDLCRYLCWTNARVAEINARVRKLIYGVTPTPFIAGERVLVRSNITSETGDVVINTNDEATVESIAANTFIHEFEAHEAGKYKDGRSYDALPARAVSLPVWDVRLVTRSGASVDTRIPIDGDDYKAICDQITAEARRNRTRWYEFFSFTDRIARLQSVYAMTVHCSQGSTFANVFVDMGDCGRNRKIVEMLKLLYVACTRPQKALVLV